ncbi:MAG TPA: DegT/DnrJ/EryC1/StrS family aminotransferase [Anaerovoracaceae bacterium]|nr:DegT/DnrJ/EryC1/StrS family aminotransferase [Anaerovoracaceae bacterium]
MKFPLGQNVHDASDILNMIDTLLTEKFTMGEQVSAFETMFAEYVGVKHAMMVNSGSSANLIALAVLTNYKCKGKLQPGDEVLVPVLCWSTSVFPIIQCGLTPVFVDVDPVTLNIDLVELERKITPKTKAIMLVHVLGNCTEMQGLMQLVRHYDLLLIEDTCESLGSLYDNQYLGTFGDIGTFSFYYSHHITTMEGGMIVTDDDDYYELMKCLRAHGWSRNLNNKDQIQEQYPDVDPRFTFVNLGYNVRPMEIQAAMGISQLQKLKTKNDNRKLNYQAIKSKIETDPRNTFISFPKASDKADVAWFGVTLFLNESVQLKEYLNYLTANGVENRPIITGNIVRQPVIKDLYPDLNPLDFPGAEECHFRGLFIGLSTNLMSEATVQELVDILLGYKP